MAKKHVYSKDTTGFGDFIYVDLLPDVKRSRQFNVNVIIALLYAVVVGFIFIYLPYSDAVFHYEELSGINYDLKHELLNEKKTDKMKVMNDILYWIISRL